MPEFRFRSGSPESVDVTGNRAKLITVRYQRSALDNTMPYGVDYFAS